MLLIRIVCLFLFSFSALKGSDVKHDFHTSLTEMRYNEGSKAFEVTIRVFTDDLEAMIRAHDKGMSLSDANADKIIEAYIKRNFAFVKGKEVLFGSFLGKESEDDVTWLYLEVNNGEVLFDGFKILNSIFFDYFDDQKNLVNVLYKKERTTLIFSDHNKLQAFPF